MSAWGASQWPSARVRLFSFALSSFGGLLGLALLVVTAVASVRRGEVAAASGLTSPEDDPCRVAFCDARVAWVVWLEMLLAVLVHPWPLLDHAVVAAIAPAHSVFASPAPWDSA